MSVDPNGKASLTPAGHIKESLYTFLNSSTPATRAQKSGSFVHHAEEKSKCSSVVPATVKSEEKGSFVDEPSSVYCRFKIGVIDLDDVSQTIRVCVTIYFYFLPPTAMEVKSNSTVRFVNFSSGGNRWKPNIDFSNQTAERILLQESYWVDRETNRVFGILVYVLSIQDRFDHHAFPFDRQIIDLQALFNNCQVKRWVIKDDRNFPPELSIANNDWIVQAELNAIADSFDLIKVGVQCLNDSVHNSSIVHVQIFMEREPYYYFWNIVIVYFVIIFLKAALVCFPYNETRFDFAMTLALTTVAFMFVVTTMVPRTSYLTQLDKYMLLGLLLLFVRFVSDITIQFAMEEYLPFGEFANRVSCSEENKNSYGVTPCEVDIILTCILAGIWILYFFYFCACTFFYQELARPSWDKVDRKVGVDANLEKEVAGANDWHVEDRVITNQDLDDAVDYEFSREEFAQNRVGFKSKLFRQNSLKKKRKSEKSLLRKDSATTSNGAKAVPRV